MAKRSKVFGDAKGNLVEDIKKPWNTVNLTAHGYDVEWTAGGKLSEQCWIISGRSIYIGTICATRH
jgi:hypothetical protein